MKKSTKILLGIATIWTIISYFLYFVSFFVYIATMETQEMAGPDLFLSPMFITMMGFNMLSMFITIALMIYYISHLLKKSQLEKEYRIIWVILILFAGTIAMPVYWFLYIWKTPENQEISNSKTKNISKAKVVKGSRKSKAS